MLTRPQSGDRGGGASLTPGGLYHMLLDNTETCVNSHKYTAVYRYTGIHRYTVYTSIHSPSDFRELRFCGRALHTACEGAGDARGCPRAAGRCATWCGTPQKRRRHGRFCAQHAQRCDVALRTTAVSGEPNQPVADRVSCPTIGTTLSTCADSSMLISVLRFLRAIDVEIVGVERG